MEWRDHLVFFSPECRASCAQTKAQCLNLMHPVPLNASHTVKKLKIAAWMKNFKAPGDVCERHISPAVHSLLKVSKVFIFFALKQQRRKEPNFYLSFTVRGEWVHATGKHPAGFLHCPLSSRLTCIPITEITISQFVSAGKAKIKRKHLIKATFHLALPVPGC